MNKFEYQKIVQSLPGLTEDGFNDTRSGAYEAKRKKFIHSAVYLQQVLDARNYLAAFQKSVLVSSWQREHCRPSKLKDLIEWHSQRPVSIGAIIVAAMHLDFKLVRDNQQSEPSLNIFARQLEAEFRDFRVRQIIKQAVG
jgi:hypothetical protein